MVKNKKLFAILTLVCFMFTLMPVAAMASDTTTVTTEEQLRDAIAKGGEVVLADDIVLSTTASSIIIDHGNAVELDLAGYDIKQKKEQVAGYSMIDNKGTLIIKDTVGGGIISYTDTGNGGEYVSDTIMNYGTLTVTGGTIKNMSDSTVADNGYPHAIDNNTTHGNTATLNICGGTVYCENYSAVRLFCGSTEKYNNASISDGATIKGAVDVQNGSKDVKCLGNLTITGGSFETTANSNNIRIADWGYYGSVAPISGIQVSISGGSFNGGIYNNLANVKNFIKSGTFSDLASAIQYAADRAVINIPAIKITGYIAPWLDATHASEKSITILGVNAKNNPNSNDWTSETILTGGLYLGYDDNHCSDTTITIKGITFEGKGLLISGQENVVIENNKFKNISDVVATSGTANANAISVTGQSYQGKEGTATINNNYIDTTASAGINLRDSDTVTITGNYIANTNHNAITIQNGVAGSAVNISGNEMTNWGTGEDKEGRAIRAAFAGDTTSDSSITMNKMSHTMALEEYVKVTGTAVMDMNNNYWGGGVPNALLGDKKVSPVYYVKDTMKNPEDLNTYVNITLAETASVVEGGTITLTANVVANEEKNKTVTWTSSNTSVATVDENGKVAAVGIGSATITATAGDKSATCVVTVKAKHTVTFDSNGGSDVAPQYVLDGENVSKPSDPTRDGYTFAGWYSDEACTTAYKFDATVTAPITLYAKWNYIPVYVPDYSGTPSTPSTSDKTETTTTVTPSGNTVKVETETKADGTKVETTTTTTASGETTKVEVTTETDKEGTTVETTKTTDAKGETTTSVTATLDNGSAVTNNDDAVKVEVSKVEEKVVAQVEEALKADEAVTVVGTADNAVSVSAANASTGAAQANFTQPMSVSVPVDTAVLNNVTDTSKLTMAKVVTNEDGTTELVYMGGSYDKATGTFNAKVDEDGDYILVEKEDLVKIELNVGEIDIKHNETATKMEVAPEINEDNRTMLQLSYIADALGCQTFWDEATRTVTVVKGDITMKIVIDELIPGFDTKAVVKNGRTLVPAGYISGMLGANVIWDPAAQQVIIVK